MHSVIGNEGFERPVSLRFDPEGISLYIVDFGLMPHTEEGAHPVEKTGVLWKISRMDKVRNVK